MAIEAHAPFSTEGLGPCELSCSRSTYHSPDLLKQLWVFWSRCGDDEGRCGKSHHLSATADGAMIKNQIKRFLELLLDPLLPEWWRCLVQFWGLVKIGDKTYLTTCDQPFALQYSSHLEVKKLCEYRKHCLEYLIPVDDDDDDVQLIGPAGRVFCSGLPEYALDVRDYTSREYLQRDYAVDCVEQYWALPIYHAPGHVPIGVLEIVSPHNSYIPQHWVLEKLQNLPRDLNLTTTCVSLLAEVNSCQDGEIAQIGKALLGASATHQLDDTETWTSSGEILSSHYGVDFIRKGQGVVGRAFSSKSACFCRDVRQLSITEYPVVHTARSCEYSACFAVCLQSSCSDNCIYVLEFFLPTDEEDYGDPRTLLRSLMEILKERLGSSFKIASGQELGQKLTVEVIKVSPGNEFDSFEICNTTGMESTPRLGEVQGGGGEGMTQVDFSSQQVDAANAYINGVHGQQSGIVGSPPRSERAQGFVDISYLELNLAGVDVAHNSMNGIYEQQAGIVRSSIGQVLVQNMVSVADYEPIVEDPERDDASIEESGDEVTNLKMKEPSCTLKCNLGITREVLEQNSARKLEDAAKNIRVSRSTLKRICRDFGINRCPPRKARKVSQALAVQKTVQPSTEDTHEQHRSDATRVEDDNGMWVKAEYQGRMIKFRLPFSARKIDLEENVVQRLNVALGSFIIEYQDEDSDRIWITCDEVLRTAMSTLSSLDRTTIKMYIVEDSPSKRDQ
nr:protein NLP6-like [Coffea arabica]